jgi:hypothetical protein
MNKLEHILLFKTDIQNEECKAKLQPILDSNADITKWNIALDDSDYVLRIVSATLNHQQIITLINTQGYSCCELT